jgi:4-diphosphocytidyl-2-C-methyl-D-erythritol kinase
MNTLSVKAFAKINLSLDIVGIIEKESGNYHAIRSIMQAISLCDEVTVETKGHAGLFGGARIRLTLTDSAGNAMPDLPADEHNLGWRAAARMADHFCPDRGNHVRIHITKRIPVAAGLAGGSTDAAAVMLALAVLWKTKVGLKDLCEIGAGLGADIPFCLIAIAKNNPALGYSADPMAATAALAEGIGDLLTPLPSPGGELLLYKPEVSVPTRDIYHLYDEMSVTAFSRPDTDLLTSILSDSAGAGIAPQSLGAFTENMKNVFEPVTAAAYPVVGESLALLRSALKDEADRVMMSGSGPTVFAWRSRRDGEDQRDWRSWPNESGLAPEIRGNNKAGRSDGVGISPPLPERNYLQAECL